MSLELSVVYRFGAFDLDTRRRLLLSADDGRVITLTPKVFDLLLYLIEHRGYVIEKSELLDAIWPNVVVEENNLTQAISALRRALGERPQEHRYIATVPGRGYQFVAEVREPVESPGNRAVSPADEGRTDARASAPVPSRRRRALVYAPLVAALIVAAIAVQQAILRNSASVAPGGFRITSTELVGGDSAGQSQPTLSPDGLRAAFVSDVSGISQVFVINLERGGPRQLTYQESGASYPSWSPLGDRIVYQAGDGGIWSIDPMGTLKPRLIIEDGVSPSLSWDGSMIVYESGSEIRLANVDGSAQRTVVGVAYGDRQFVRAYPSISPDGSQIVFFQQNTGPLGDYWIVPAAGGEARQLTFDLHWGGRPTWTPDGLHVVFPSKRGGTLTLWNIAAAGGNPEPLTTGLGVDSDPVVSRDGRKLLYTTTRVESYFVVTSPETRQDKIVYRHRRLIAFPRVSPDGRLIAFFSEFEPREQIMVMSVDGTDVEQITEYRANEANVFPRWSPDGEFIYYYQNLPPASLRRIPVAGGAYEEIFPEFSWDLNMDFELSPSGERVAFIRVDPATRERRLVVRNLRDGEESLLPVGIRFAPSWSDDGQALLGTAPNRVLICPASGADCTAVIDDSGASMKKYAGQPLGHYAQWSSDESRVFFSRRTEHPGMLALWVVARDGSEPRRLFEYGSVHPLAGRFQVLPDDTILWDRYDHGESELILATLSRNEN